MVPLFRSGLFLDTKTAPLCMVWLPIHEPLLFTIIFHQPEIRWLGEYSPHKPPFGVRSCEVVIIHPDYCPCSKRPLLKGIRQHRQLPKASIRAYTYEPGSGGAYMAKYAPEVKPVLKIFALRAKLVVWRRPPQTSLKKRGPPTQFRTHVRSRLGVSPCRRGMSQET